MYRGISGGDVPIQTQDYKSLCVAFTTCLTLVNTQTHTDSFRPVILAQPVELKQHL